MTMREGTVFQWLLVICAQRIWKAHGLLKGKVSLTSSLSPSFLINVHYTQYSLRIISCLFVIINNSMAPIYHNKCHTQTCISGQNNLHKHEHLLKLVNCCRYFHAYSAMTGLGVLCMSCLFDVRSSSITSLAQSHLCGCNIK